jgi:hypothetical protein
MAAHLLHRPSRPERLLSTPLPLEPGCSPSHRPATPGAAVYRAATSFHTDHHQPPSTIFLLTCAIFCKLLGGPPFVLILYFITGDQLSELPMSSSTAELLIVTRLLQWAPRCPATLNKIPIALATSLKAPCLATRCRLARNGRWSRTGKKGWNVPCFGPMGQKAEVGWAASRRLGQVHSGLSLVAQFYLIVSIQFISIQIQINFKLLKFMGTWL